MTYQDSKTRAKNRKKIVDVARNLFIEQGIAHTTIMEIVKSCNMERKTFYNYFFDKEEIADYIYYQEMKKFYEEGFGSEVYEGLDSGYLKIEKYLKTVVSHFIKFSHEMLFAVHHDYYFRKQATTDVIAKIYEEAGVVSPSTFFVEGVEDKSIDIGEADPEETFFLIAQSVGAYASRLIFRGYKFGVKNVSLDFTTLTSLVDLHLKAIKASEK